MKTIVYDHGKSRKKHCTNCNIFPDSLNPLMRIFLCMPTLYMIYISKWYEKR